MNADIIHIAVASLVFAAAGCDLRPTDEEQTADSAQTGDAGESGEVDDSEGPDEAPELSEEDAEALAEVAADAGDGASGESALVATVAVAASDAAENGASTGEEMAEAAADGTTVAALCPGGGFATATRDGSVVTYAFVGCTSHCGLVRGTGEVEVTYSATAGGVGVDIEATDFRINGTRTDLSVAAEYRREGTLASMSIDTDATVTGWFGWQLTRTGAYDATFDSASQCITHDGAWTTQFGQVGYSTTVDNYRRCALQCPDAGSRIALETLDDAYSFEAEFTSPTTLEWGTSNGWAGTLEIPACG